METNQQESVTQSEASGTSTDVVNENLSKPEKDWRADMLRYKDEATKLKDQLNDINLNQQQKKGDLEGVINSLKEELKTLKTKNATDRYNFANTQIDSAVRNEALARGLNGSAVDILLKIVDKNDKGAVALDESFNVSGEDVKSLVDKQLDRYGDLFKKQVKVVDGAPRGGTPPKPKPVADPSTMTSAQLKQYILENKQNLK